MIPNSALPNAEFLWYLDLIAVFLSLFGSFWMICSCLQLPTKRNLTVKIILAISIADFLYSIANLLSNFESPESMLLCYTEATLRQFSFTLTIFFSVCLAICSYYSAFPRKNFNKSLFFVLSIIIGVVLCFCQIELLPNMFDDGDIVMAYGPFFCWFTYNQYSEESTQLLVLMIYHGAPILLGFFLTAIVYGLAIRAMRKLPKALLDIIGFNVYQVLWYPLIFFITFVPHLIDLTIRVYSPERPLILEALHLFLTHSIGFSNALVYGIQRNLYNSKYEEADAKSENTVPDEDGNIDDRISVSYFRRDTVLDSLKNALS